MFESNFSRFYLKSSCCGGWNLLLVSCDKIILVSIFEKRWVRHQDYRCELEVPTPAGGTKKAAMIFLGRVGSTTNYPYGLGHA